MIIVHSLEKEKKEKKHILIAISMVFICLLLLEIFYSPFKRYIIYSGLEHFVSSEIVQSPIVDRYGLGSIVLTPPPLPNPSILKIDLAATPQSAKIDLDDIKNKGARFPIKITAYLNKKGRLVNCTQTQSTDNREVDSYIFNRVRKWVYTSATAEGKMEFVIAPRAGEVIIRFDDNFKVTAERIGRGPYMGLFDSHDFRAGIRLKFEGRNL